MFFDLLSMAYSNLKKRGLRSGLTIFGVVVGIVAIVALISLGLGMNDYVNQQLENIGKDKAIILSDIGAKEKLDENDLKVIEDIDDVRSAYGTYTSIVFMNSRSESERATITALDTSSERIRAFMESNPVDVEKGKFLDGESRTVVIGNDLAREKFEHELDVGDKISINNNDFKIIGILKESNSMTIDEAAFISMEDAEEILDADGFSEIVASGRSGIDLEKFVLKIEEELRKSRGLKEGEEDFRVESSQDIEESLSSVLAGVNWFLIGIASISLLVGIIGITNTMQISVAERRKEIGIMKALGARNSHISLLFLLESGMLGLIGGAIGTALGLLLSKIASVFISAMMNESFSASFSFPLIMFSLALSFLIGMIAGTIPAYQASRQDPIKILREE